MNKIIYIVIALMTITLPDVFGQEYYNDQLTIENLNISKEGDVINISMDVNLNNLKLNKNEMLIVTPVILSKETEDAKELEPFTVIGKLRNKVLQRSYNSIGKVVLNFPENSKVIRKNGTDQSIQYASSLPFDEWQRDAQFVLRTEVIGCADCLDNEPDMLLTDRLLPERFVPEYSYTYIVPDVEEVKQRSETYSAYLNYMVGRWNLLREYKNNATELKKVEDIIMELKNNPDLTISDFTITGYASPEGSSQSNLLLSQRRAESFAKFLETKYEYDVSQFTIKWAGEDWNGLKEAVAASGLANKNDIIEIINTVSDQDARDGRIIALDNGVTYKRLLNDFYPQLRRNDYNIAFVSRPFNVKEASEIIKTSPNLLSLNEMFHVANTFPADSEEFREVFVIAVNTFPESETANINVAVAELNNNNIDAALSRLEKMKDNPAAWNLLGVCYAQKGMNEQAVTYFNRAIDNGDEAASGNLKQLERYIKNN